MTYNHVMILANLYNIFREKNMVFYGNWKRQIQKRRLKMEEQILTTAAEDIIVETVETDNLGNGLAFAGGLIGGVLITKFVFIPIGKFICKKVVEEKLRRSTVEVIDPEDITVEQTEKKKK